MTSHDKDDLKLVFQDRREAQVWERLLLEATVYAVSQFADFDKPPSAPKSGYGASGPLSSKSMSAPKSSKSLPAPLSSKAAGPLSQPKPPASSSSKDLPSGFAPLKRARIKLSRLNISHDILRSEQDLPERLFLDVIASSALNGRRWTEEIEGRIKLKAVCEDNQVPGFRSMLIDHTLDIEVGPETDAFYYVVQNQKPNKVSTKGWCFIGAQSTRDGSSVRLKMYHKPVVYGSKADKATPLPSLSLDLQISNAA